MPLEPLAIGVCSWSLQVTSVPELKRLLDAARHRRRADRLRRPAPRLLGRGRRHARGRRWPPASSMTGAMLGFPGEDYTTPQTIQKTGGFGDPATRPERLERFAWALDRTLRAGPDRPDAARRLHPRAGRPRPQAVPRHARRRSATWPRPRASPSRFETGQETADLLRRTLDELKCPNLKVNFDPANMLLYDKGDPLRAVEILGPDIRSVHVKDANRPTTPGHLGRGGAARPGAGRTSTQFVQTLKKVGYRGPLCIEREVGNQEERVADIAHGVRFLRECLA